jgi:hypothetical protein
MAYQPNPWMLFLRASIDAMQMQAAKALLSVADKLQLNRFTESLARLERQDRRSRRRYMRSVNYASAGLNGKRAIARHQSQIDSGRLTVANGLVA